MKGLASFVMRGLSQAVMVTTVLALLSLLLPLFGILSAATVGLVTLRNGARPGITVSLLSTLVCGLFMAVSFGNPLPALGFLLLQWLPMVLLGILLRASRSLELSVQLSLLFGLLVIVSQYLMFDDPAAFWQQQLQPLVEQFEAAGILDKSNGEQVLSQMVIWMPGVLSAGLFMQLVVSLLVARWWQALLYNPGGFREEFHRFRLHKVIGVLGVPALAVLLLPTQEMAAFFKHLAILLLPLLFLSGLAVSHGILSKTGSGGIWLGVVYFLLIFLMPQVVMVLATLGLMDVWIDFRTRFERGRSAG